MRPLLSPRSTAMSLLISSHDLHRFSFSYTAYIGSVLSLVLFQGPMIWRTIKTARAGGQMHNDRLNVLMRKFVTVSLRFRLSS